jgi:hypothetical protein
MPGQLDRPLWWVATIGVWFLSLLVFFGGLIFVLIAIVGFMDPVGTKMADDADPFGAPPTIFESMVALACALAVLLVGLCLPVAYHHFIKRPRVLAVTGV